MYESTDQIYKAEDEYLKVVEINPKHIEAQMSLAKIYIIRDLKDKAMMVLNTVVEIEPHIFEAHLELARINHGNNSLEEAAENYNKAISIKPNAPQAHVELANVYLDLNKTSKAIDEYKNMTPQQLKDDRYNKFRRMGVFNA